MHNWKITPIGSAETICTATASTRPEAWVAATGAAMDQIAAATLTGCTIIVDSIPALLVAGRTEDGQLDLPGTRAAAERMAFAAFGGLLCVSGTATP